MHKKQILGALISLALVGVGFGGAATIQTVLVANPTDSDIGNPAVSHIADSDSSDSTDANSSDPSDSTPAHNATCTTNAAGKNICVDANGNIIDNETIIEIEKEVEKEVIREVEKEVIRDKTSPIASAATYSNTAMTNQDVVVTAAFNKAIKLPAGWQFTAGSQTKIFRSYSANFSGTIAVQDTAGNAGSFYVNVKNIDKVAPVCESAITYGKGEVWTYEITCSESVTIAGWNKADDRTFIRTFGSDQRDLPVEIIDAVGNATTLAL